MSGALAPAVTASTDSRARLIDRTEAWCRERLDDHGMHRRSRLRHLFDDEFRRWRLGRGTETRHATQQRSVARLYLPGLHAQPWWNGQGAWPRLGWKAIGEAITEEFLALATGSANLERYLRDDEPGVDRHTIDGWRSVFLLRNGRWCAHTARRCPRTVGLLDRLPWFPGDVMFSVLGPGVKLPPHHGLDNLHLTFHLPLVVPGRCSLVVAGQPRVPHRFEPLLFDDTYLHHASNLGDLARVHLLVDLFHPELVPREVQALRATMPALLNMRLALGG